MAKGATVQTNEALRLKEALLQADSIIKAKEQLRDVLQRLAEVIETASDNRNSDEFVGNVFRATFHVGRP